MLTVFVVTLDVLLFVGRIWPLLVTFRRSLATLVTCLEEGLLAWGDDTSSELAYLTCAHALLSRVLVT